MHKSLRSLRRLVVASCILASHALLAEVVYLKDGQVLNGAIIKETDKIIWVKTKYKTSKLNRKQILRILYGSRELEKIFIQLKDERLIEAFMVDQDNEKVTIRITQDDPKEQYIKKKDIAQMSNERILPLRPELSLRSGYYIPLNTTNGADLEPNIMTLAGYGLRLLFLSNSRVLFEAGFAKNTSTFTDVDGKTRELSLQTIPMLFSYIYRFNFSRFFSSGKTDAKGSSTISLDTTYTTAHRFDIIGKASAGASFLTFDNAEGEKLNGIKLTLAGGLGLSYEILRRRLYVEILGEYFYINDEGSNLQAALASLRLAYRY